MPSPLLTAPAFPPSPSPVMPHHTNPPPNTTPAALASLLTSALAEVERLKHDLENANKRAACAENVLRSLSSSQQDDDREHDDKDPAANGTTGGGATAGIQLPPAALNALMQCEARAGAAEARLASLMDAWGELLRLEERAVEERRRVDDDTKAARRAFEERAVRGAAAYASYAGPSSGSSFPTPSTFSGSSSTLSLSSFAHPRYPAAHLTVSQAQAQAQAQSRQQQQQQQRHAMSHRPSFSFAHGTNGTVAAANPSSNSNTNTVLNPRIRPRTASDAAIAGHPAKRMRANTEGGLVAMRGGAGADWPEVQHPARHTISHPPSHAHAATHSHAHAPHQHPHPHSNSPEGLVGPGAPHSTPLTGPGIAHSHHAHTDADADADGEREDDALANDDARSTASQDLDDLLLEVAGEGQGHGHGHGRRHMRVVHPEPTMVGHPGSTHAHGEPQTHPASTHVSAHGESTVLNAPSQESRGGGFPAINAQGQRTCRQCGQPGRYKDGKCVEKWGPGPEGPGTVCDRCRKKMKRVERRGDAAGGAMERRASLVAPVGVAEAHALYAQSQSSQSQTQSQLYAHLAQTHRPRSGSQSQLHAPAHPHAHPHAHAHHAQQLHPNAANAVAAPFTHDPPSRPGSAHVRRKPASPSGNVSPVGTANGNGAAASFVVNGPPLSQGGSSTGLLGAAQSLGTGSGSLIMNGSKSASPVNGRFVPRPGSHGSSPYASASAHSKSKSKSGSPHDADTESPVMQVKREGSP